MATVTASTTMASTAHPTPAPTAGGTALLEIRPVRLLRWDFTVTTPDGRSIEVKQATLRDRATTTIEGAEITMQRTSLWKGEFVLVQEGAVVAKARKPGFWRRDVAVASGENAFILRPKSWISRAYLVEDGFAQVGRIEPIGSFTRKMTAELPDTVPLAYRVFLIWLVWIQLKEASESS